MNIIEIIEKKKNKKNLSYEELKYAVQTFLDGSTKDYQMSSLLMAITINGMTEQETIDLTDIMLNSGEKMDLNSIDGIIVDKHSTGGVGDKITIILSALIPSCGVKFAKMSGRGLGFTGGTIDKLESINMNTQIELNDFIKQINEIGVAVAGQTKNLVPADKKIYALRDVTGTTQSLPLIASSIMSKKIASGADKIVIDLKVGNGALIKNVKDAKILANLMIKIAKKYNRELICVLTDMNSPLGNAIGNSIEIKESIDVLQGKGPQDVRKLSLTLASYMISMSKKISLEKALKEATNALDSGKAYEKFKQFIKAQKGNIDNIELAPKIFSIKSIKDGYITHINTSGIGEIVKKIGGGRETKEDIINFKVGLLLSKKIGDYVKKDEELLKVYLDQKDISIKEILDCFEFGNTKKKNKLIKYIIK